MFAVALAGQPGTGKKIVADILVDQFKFEVYPLAEVLGGVKCTRNSEINILVPDIVGIPDLVMVKRTVDGIRVLSTTVPTYTRLRRIKENPKLELPNPNNLDEGLPILDPELGLGESYNDQLLELSDERISTQFDECILINQLRLQLENLNRAGPLSKEGRAPEVISEEEYLLSHPEFMNGKPKQREEIKKIEYTVEEWLALQGDLSQSRRR